MSAYVRIRRHTSADVGIRQHTSAYVSIRQAGGGSASLLPRRSAYASCPHTSAYVRMRPHTLTFCVAAATAICVCLMSAYGINMSAYCYIHAVSGQQQKNICVAAKKKKHMQLAVCYIRSSVSSLCEKIKKPASFPHTEAFLSGSPRG
jgi:hypothetical protein